MFSRALLVAAALASSVIATTGSHAGKATYYDVGLGACGIVSSADQMVVAVPDTMYSGYPGATANPNLNPICGQQIRAYYGDKSVDVTVVDRCGGCTGFDLDFSRSAFAQLSDLGPGHVQITWDWLTGVSSGVLAPTQPPATTAPPATTTAAPPATTPGSTMEYCSTEGAIRCPNENSWEICGSGYWQYNGQLAYPYVCRDGQLVLQYKKRHFGRQH
ncbi:RlpA-like double-psi beta-barrel-protein domain-containing protein-containing protein [Schizophyllum amplum]|uniref:RlpA-like double-psi beta-barrel-protein domain-containing protein-containing protein n=1 Tax=Schizophyllum amplum TaxID=97359 RepID=A0A550CGM8_9AGAR|nr:RlpA-like double-psi beta-barrel-protein domain-containing protein-containing protein [Auriculariopsis ampla]